MSAGNGGAERGLRVACNTLTPNPSPRGRGGAHDSGAVLGVDLDVLVGQVGGPDGFAAGATAQLDADADLCAGHDRRALVLGIGRCTTTLAGDTHLPFHGITEEHV